MTGGTFCINSSEPRKLSIKLEMSISSSVLVLTEVWDGSCGWYFGGKMVEPFGLDMRMGLE